MSNTVREIAARLSIVEAAATIGAVLYVVIAFVFWMFGSAILLPAAGWLTVAIAPVLGFCAWRDPELGGLRWVTVPTAMAASVIVIPAILVAPIVWLGHKIKSRHAGKPQG